MKEYSVRLAKTWTIEAKSEKEALEIFVQDELHYLEKELDRKDFIVEEVKR